MATKERKRESLWVQILQDEGSSAKPLSTLPFIYVTNRQACRVIFEDDHIACEERPKNKTDAMDDLKQYAILFYGSPVFLENENADSKRITGSSCLPCCLILNTSKIYAKHIFPFDRNSCPEGWDIFTFELPPNIEKIPVYVQRYFSSNENYLHGKSDRSSPTITSLEEEELWNLLSDTNKSVAAKTVEILCDEFDLGGAIEAIVVPNSILGHIDYKELKQRHSQMEVLDYEDRYPSLPNEYRGAVYGKVMDYYKEKGLIEKRTS